MAQVSADLELAIDAALAQVDALEARLTEVAVIELRPELDTATAEAELASLSDTPVVLDADLSSARDQLDELAASPPPIDFAADLSAAFDDLNALAEQERTVSVDLNVDAALAELDGLFDDVQVLAVDADTSQAQAQIDELGESVSGAGAGIGGLTDNLGLLDTAQSGVSASGIGLVAALGRAPSATTAAALGYGAAGAAALELANLYGEAEGVATRTNLIIENTGGQANVSAAEVSALASEIQGYSGILDDEAIASGANFVLGLENIRNEAGAGNDVFTRLIKVSGDYAAFTGGEVTSVTQRFGRALNDPVRGLSLLRRSGVLFTAEQEELVTSLTESGDILGAQRVLLDSLEERYQGAAEAAGDTYAGALAKLRRTAEEAGEALGSGLAPALETVADSGLVALDVLDRIGGAIGDIPGVGNEGLGVADLATPGGPGVRALLDGPDAFAQPIAEPPDPTVVRAFEEFLASRPSGLIETVDQLSSGQGILDDATEDATDSLDDQADTFSKTETAASGLRDTLDELFGTQQSVDEGAIDIRNNQRDLLQSLVELEGGYRAGTESGDAFLSTAQELGQSIREQTIRMLENGASADEARFAQLGYTDGLRRVLRQAGFTNRQVEELIRTYAEVPEDRITQFETPGMDPARRGAKGLREDVLSIPASRHIQITTNAATVAREFALLAGEISNAGAVAASHQDDFHAAAPNRAVVGVKTGDGDTVVHQTIQFLGPVRDPEAAGAAVKRSTESALRGHRLRVATKLGQP